MIAKISKGAGFEGCLRYNLDKEKGRVLASNLDLSKGASPSALAKEFRAFANLNERCENPVLHIPISFGKNDNPSDEQMKEAAIKFLQKFEMKMNGGVKPEGIRPFIIVRHTDTSHQHLHIITSRVNSEGKVLKDSNDYKEANKICRQLEKEMGFEEVPSVQKSGMKSLDLKEVNMEKRRKKENSSFLTPRKDLIGRIQEASKPVGGGKRTFASFISELKKEGVEVYLNTSADHSKINGISYSLEHDKQNRVFKGSALGKNFTWNKLLNDVDFNEKRDKDLVVLLANKDRFSKEKLSNSEVEIIKNNFKQSIISYQKENKKPAVFNLEYRLNKVDFSEKRALHIQKMNVQWNDKNYKNDPIKYFESIYKSDQVKQHKKELFELNSASKEVRKRTYKEAENCKNQLNFHLKTFMEKEGFEYSKAIHERIKPLNFTAADINEVKTLSQEWKKGDFSLSPMAYVYDRIQIHQEHFKENLNGALERLDKKYGQEGKFLNAELTKDLLKLADETNFDRQVPAAILKLDKEVLPSLSEQEQKSFTNEKVLNFVSTELSKNSQGFVSSQEESSEVSKSFEKNDSANIADMFKGIGSGASGSGPESSEDKTKKRRRKRRRIE